MHKDNYAIMPVIPFEEVDGIILVSLITKKNKKERERENRRNDKGEERDRWKGQISNYLEAESAASRLETR